ncbi:hypothetical protein ACF0H5_012252 [Mactra antiquata]
MSVSGGSVDSHMMKLRMKLVQQKIQNEKDKMQRPPSIESNSNEDDLDKQARLQQAMLRRQELLDRIRREQLLNEENKRPRTYSANRRRYTPSPVQPPPSRRSLPEFARMQSMNQYYHQRPDTHRSKPEMSQVKHVIEHKIATPRQQNPYQLPPIQQPGQALQPPAIVQPQQPPQIVSMQQPAPPAIIQGPAPQHIFTTGYQQPVIHNLGAPTQENKPQGMFNKSEMGDMMMMQTAQLHQMVMQKMMINDMGGGTGGCGSGRTHSSCSSHHHGHHGHGHHHGCACSVCVPIVDVPRINPGGAVHHHHYTSPPPSQPAIHHYTSLPAMDIRGGYPYRGELMGGYTYADPYSYSPVYEYYQ